MIQIRCLLQQKFESNQSGIETQSCLSSGYAKLFVWIEPEWNWNYVSAIYVVENANVFESNQSGIETSTFFSTDTKLKSKFESNQSGIETSDIINLKLSDLNPFESNQSGIETLYRLLI